MQVKPSQGPTGGYVSLVNCRGNISLNSMNVMSYQFLDCSIFNVVVLECNDYNLLYHGIEPVKEMFYGFMEKGRHLEENSWEHIFMENGICN